MGSLLPVREFASVEEMRAHVKALRDQTFAAKPEPARPATPSALPRRVTHGPFIPPPAVTPADISLGRPLATMIALIVATTGVPAVDLLGQRRLATTVKARQIAAWLCRRFTTRSLPQIGTSLGGRDHTTILHACRRVDAIVGRHALAPAEDVPELWAQILWQAEWGRGA